MNWPKRCVVQARELAAGAGWRAVDLPCSLGPRDRAEEEQHGRTSVSLVMAGTFTYEGATGRVLLTPGSLLLGQAGRCFCCRHEHATGDRCLSFQYEPDLAEELRPFRGARIPPLAATRPLWAAAQQWLREGGDADALRSEQLALQFLAVATRQDTGLPASRVTLRDERRVVLVVRELEVDYAAAHTLASLAQRAGLTRHHFLRTFRAVTGVTPYQYLLSLRLAAAAARLLRTEASVTEVAAEVGFGDLSEFTRRFRAEFGRPPGAWRNARRQGARHGKPQ